MPEFASWTDRQVDDSWLRGETNVPQASTINTINYLAICAKLYSMKGFVNSKIAQEQNIASTKGVALKAYWSGAEERVEEEFYEIARQTVAWAKALNHKGNSFLRELKTALAQEMFPSSRAGWVAAAIATKDRDLKQTTQRTETSEKEAKSAFVGTTGDRMDFHLTLRRKFETSTKFGIAYQHKWETQDGSNIMIWWASNPTTYEVDQDYMVSATIKAHNEFRGVKQTVLTNVRRI